MSEPPVRPEQDDPNVPPAAPAPPAGVPRWVKVFGGVALALLVLLVLVQLVGAGEHGPGRHTGSPAAGDPARVHVNADRQAPPEAGR